jgi:hypothetical protein
VTEFSTAEAIAKQAASPEAAAEGRAQRCRLLEDKVDQLWTALIRCREALEERNNPAAGAKIDFALETAEMVLSQGKRV